MCVVRCAFTANVVVGHSAYGGALYCLIGGRHRAVLYDGLSQTYLDLGPPVPLGASGDQEPPSITVTGDPAGSMPADSHLFEVFFEGATPCLLRPRPLSTAVFGHSVHCCVCGSFLRQPEDVASHFQSPFF